MELVKALADKVSRVVRVLIRCIKKTSEEEDNPECKDIYGVGGAPTMGIFRSRIIYACTTAFLLTK